MLTRTPQKKRIYIQYKRESFFCAASANDLLLRDFPPRYILSVCVYKHTQKKKLDISIHRRRSIYVHSRPIEWWGPAIVFEPMTSESPFTKIRLSYCVTDAIGGLMDQGAHARTTCALLLSPLSLFFFYATLSDV